METREERSINNRAALKQGPASPLRNTHNSVSSSLRWPKYWSFSFSISPSNEYSGLIETCMQVKNKARTEHGTMDWFKIGKEHVKAACCHPAYLTYIQSTSCEMPGWMKHKPESRLLGETSVTSDMQMTPPLWWKAKRN